MNAEGGTGAHKIFNLLKKRLNGSILHSLASVSSLLERKSEYVRAMNIIVLSKSDKLLYVQSLFNEDPNYFTLHINRSTDAVVISSELLKTDFSFFDQDWEELPNRCLEVY